LPSCPARRASSRQRADWRPEIGIRRSIGHPHIPRPWNPIRASVATVNLPDGVRRWLPLPSGGQRPAGLISHTLPTTTACLLSSSVAGGVAPGHAAWALQLLEKTSRRQHAAGWHRFCLLSLLSATFARNAQRTEGYAACRRPTSASRTPRDR